MTCVKTGAIIYFENYGMYVVGDAFLLQDTYVFRWNIESIVYGTMPPRVTHCVTIVTNSDSWWHRDDLGVTVVPSYLVNTYAD